MSRILRETGMEPSCPHCHSSARRTRGLKNERRFELNYRTGAYGCDACGASGDAWDYLLETFHRSLSTVEHVLIPQALHREFTEESGIPMPMVAANVEAFGPGTASHWETVREQFLAPALHRASTESTTARGHAQGQAGHLSERLHKLRQTYRHLQAGGWRFRGLDPLQQWREPMGWGCIKPRQPRTRAKGFKASPIKYEHPPGVPLRTFWWRVPAIVAEGVAARFGLELPAEVAADIRGEAGAFWRWWATEPRLPLVVVEGAKKAAALLDDGLPAVGLPGISSGAVRTGGTGPRNLHPDLAGVPLKGRRLAVLFDHPAKPSSRELPEARTLGWRLRRAGASPVAVGVCPDPRRKGCDDHLAGGGTWEELEAALKPLEQRPVLPGLRRQPDAVAPAGEYLGEVLQIPLPEQARLVALAAAMGSGKSVLVAEHLRTHRAAIEAAHCRVLVITHRQSLAEAQAQSLDLPTGDDALPGAPLRNRGLACCIDSLCPTSALRIHPQDWRGCVVVIDELVQVLTHLQTSHGTEVRKRRAAVIAVLTEILRYAAQVIVADAQLTEAAVTAMEKLTGHRAYLIRSEHRPADGRTLYVRQSREALLGDLSAALTQRQRLFLWTAAQKAEGSNFAASNLADLVRQRWPEAKVLVIDSETVRVPGSDAARFASDPNGVAAAHDVVITTPAVTSGVSIDKLPDHFRAVFLLSGGTVPPEDVVQAAGRLRTATPCYLFCPTITPARSLRTGSGSPDPDRVLDNLQRHEQLVLQQFGHRFGTPVADPWTQNWCHLAASRNRQDSTYRATVVGLLEAEGYRVDAADPMGASAAGSEVKLELSAARQQRIGATTAQIQAAPPLTTAEARELRAQRQRTPEQHAALRRHDITQRWQVPPDAELTAKLLEADRKGVWGRLRRRWWLTEASPTQVIEHDLAAGERASSGGRYCPWDLVREQQGPRIKAAQAIGLSALLQRGQQEFTADDPAVVELQRQAELHREAIVQVLGSSVCLNGPETVKALIQPLGYRLKQRRQQVDGVRRRIYWIEPAPLPAGVTWEALAEGWNSSPGSQASPPLNAARIFPVRSIQENPGSVEAPTRGASVPLSVPPPEGTRVAVFHPLTGWREGWTVTGRADAGGRVPLRRGDRTQWVSPRHLRPAEAAPRAA